jgi:hypothetical protein
MLVRHWNSAILFSLLAYCAESVSNSESATFPFTNLLRCCGPQQVAQIDLRPSVERTPLFSLRENAIAKEPGSS